MSAAAGVGSVTGGQAGPLGGGRGAPIVSIEGVHKSFGTNKVLDDVSLTVVPGACLVIVGPSGSGKSTLLRCINQLERIDQGRIVVDGMVVGDRATSITRLRSEVGMVFQSFNLFPHKTVLENVTIGPRKVRGLGMQREPNHPMEIYLVAAAIYFVICFPLSRLALRLESRMHRSGMVQERLAV